MKRGRVESAGTPTSSMRPKPKLGYHHGSLRETLIEAGVKAVARRGVAALNLRELATRAGVSPGAPYHHFADRAALLAAIAEEGFRRFEADLVKARDAEPADASARVEALGRAYLSFAVAHPGYFRVMFHGDAVSSGPAEAGLRAFGLLREAVVACQEAGTAPAGDPEPLVLTAWSTVHGLATLWVDRALPFKGLDPARMGPEIAGLLARMFAAAGRESKPGSRGRNAAIDGCR